jgi:cell division protein FtsI/penicillin-binding protein 2
MTSSFIFRSRIILVFIFVFAFILISKLFLVQIVRNKFYSESADRQYATPSSNIYERGSIFFQQKSKNGKEGDLITAATQTTGFKVAIEPNKLGDLEIAYKALSAVIPLSHDEFMLKAEKKNDPYEEIAIHLTKEEADNVSLLKLSGVSVFKEKWRFYPGEELASQTLGVVGFKGNELAGRYGLERYYNKELSRNTDNPYVNFFAEVFSNLHNSLFKNETKEGDLVTTIDPEVQSFLEKKISEVKEHYQVDSIGGIIMNPTDGSIYAMSVKPDFNPNDLSKVKKISTLGNPMVEGVLEFGSVVKPLVMASALDMGVVTPTTSYNDKGSVVVEKKEIFSQFVNDFDRNRNVYFNINASER